MNTLRRIPAVFVFEWRRALTIPRMAWLVLLIAFPPCLLLAARATAPSEPPRDISAILIFIMSPCVACMMSVFLWATPAVAAELEGRSWVYISVRPHGPMAVLIGKYLVALSWAIPVGVLSSLLASYGLVSDRPLQVALVQMGLVCMSCVSYAAVFLLLGVIIPKRAMVAGMIYAIGFEVGAAFIPAAVNLLTIQYRLRCILVRGMDFDFRIAERNPVFRAYFGDESTAWHVGMLLMMTLAYLAASLYLLRYREFTFASETE